MLHHFFLFLFPFLSPVLSVPTILSKSCLFSLITYIYVTCVHIFINVHICNTYLYIYSCMYTPIPMQHICTYMYIRVNEYICIYMYINDLLGLSLFSVACMCVILGMTTGHWIINSCQSYLFSKHKQHLLSHEMTSSHWNLLNYSFPVPCCSLKTVIFTHLFFCLLHCLWNSTPQL